jgi:hypothetical protein
MNDILNTTFSENASFPILPLVGNLESSRTISLAAKSATSELGEAVDGPGDEHKVVAQRMTTNASVIQCPYIECSSLNFPRKCDLKYVYMPC